MKKWVILVGGIKRVKWGGWGVGDEGIWGKN